MKGDLITGKSFISEEELNEKIKSILGTSVFMFVS